MTDKFIIGTKFYKYEKSCVPVIIRLKKQNGNILFFDMGGYKTYLTQEDITSMVSNNELCINDTNNWIRTIDFFGTKVEQIWKVISESRDDLFVRFNVINVPISITAKELKENYIRLAPDSIMTISNVSYPMKDSEEKAHDVMITVHKLGERIPEIICRQDCADIFKVSANESKIPIGLSIPKDACPKNMNYLDFMYSDECKNFKNIAIYIDDEINTILRYFGSMNRYNSTIRNIKNKYEHTRFTGCSSSVIDLINNTGFVEDLKASFGIFNFPFGLDLNRSEMNNTELMMINKLVRPNTSKQFIEAHYCPYGKDIDTNKIGVNHLFINIGNPKESNLFILSFLTNE